MDVELKAKLREAIEAFLEAQASLAVSARDGSPDTLYVFIHEYLRKAKVWKKIEAQLVSDKLAEALASTIRAYEKAKADEAQLPLFAEFYHLPRRIRTGRTSLRLDKVTVPQFLTYKAKYEKRSQHDQLVVEELRRLAERIAGFAADDAVTVAEALNRAPRMVQAAGQRQAGEAGG